MVKEQFDESWFRQQTEAWMKAWIGGQTHLFDTFLDEDFILVSTLSKGELTDKAGWISQALNSKTGQSMSFNFQKLRCYPEFAIVNSIATMKAQADGKDWSGQVLLTDVWIRRSDGFKVVSRHASWPAK